MSLGAAMESAKDLVGKTSYWMRDIWPVMRQESSECRER